MKRAEISGRSSRSGTPERDEREKRFYVAGGAHFATAMAPANPDPLAGSGRSVRYCAHNPSFTGSAPRGCSLPELLSVDTPRRRAAGMERGDLWSLAFLVILELLLRASRHVVVAR